MKTCAGAKHAPAGDNHTPREPENQAGNRTKCAENELKKGRMEKEVV